MLHVDHGDQWPKNRIDQWAMKYIAVWSHVIHFLAVTNPCSYGGWLQTPAPVGNYWDSSEAQEPVVIGLLKEAHPRNSIIDKGLTWYCQCSVGVSEDGGR